MYGISIDKTPTYSSLSPTGCPNRVVPKWDFVPGGSSPQDALPELQLAAILQDDFASAGEARAAGDHVHSNLDEANAATMGGGGRLERNT